MMDHFGGKPRLGDVQETVLIPLPLTKKYDKFISHEGVVARMILFDAAVKKLLPLDLKLTLMEEHSFWEEMKKIFPDRENRKHRCKEAE